MKIIKPSWEVMNSQLDADADPLKFLEKVGRVCYKSEDRITENSAREFIAMIINKGHTAMLEHFNFLFEVDRCTYLELKNLRDYNGNNELNFTSQRMPEGKIRYLVSGNCRTINSLKDRRLLTVLYEICKELVWEDFEPYLEGTYSLRRVNLGDLDSLSDNELRMHCYVTIKFIVDREVSHELVRHRKASWAQESTRYCNYSKNKFGNELTFIDPCFFKKGTNEYSSWFYQNERAEKTYLRLIELGASPQEARSVLPNSLKTEVVMTSNLSCLQNFSFLRTDSHAHPQMREVAISLNNNFLQPQFPGLFNKVKE